MRIERDNRNLIFTDIPPACGFKSMPDRLTVAVTYSEPSNASNGIQLDNAVLPLLEASADMRDCLADCAEILEQLADDGELGEMRRPTLETARRILSSIQRKLNS